MTRTERAAEIRKRFEVARNALTLSNSMILSGESHSDESHTIIRRGLAACDLSRPLEGGE